MKIKHKLHRQSFEGKNFIATLYYPQSEGPFPGVIVIPGTDGGIPELAAKRIAAHGYATLALGYFGAEGLPPYLENIPLEGFKTAIEWFSSAPQVQARSITLLGYSRGGELVLLLGALFPNLMDGIIALVPSSMVFGGFPFLNRPAWQLNGLPAMPYLSGLTSQEETLSEAEDLSLACRKGIIPYHSNTSEDPFHVVDFFHARQMRQEKAMSAAAIPVEKITCPLLIISGEQDEIWPSSLYAKMIMDRLTQKGSNIQRKSLVYAHAGHGILAPYDKPILHPVGKFWCILGGTPEGNRQANENAWKEIFAFLEGCSTDFKA